MSRIEAALARIEAAARAAPPVDAGELAARHKALRGRVGDALAELDSLIAEVGG